MSHDLEPRWKPYLKANEAAEWAALDRAIAMHRELMAPLIEARRRIQKTAAMRVIRAGALEQQSDAA